MWKRRRGQAAEVDHVCTLIGEGACLAQDALRHREIRRVDDLREESHVVAREIDAQLRLSEMRGDVVEIVRPAHNRHTPFRRECVEVPRAEARHENTVDVQLLARQAPPNDVRGHQRRDLDADISHVPGKVGAAHLRQHSAEPSLGQMTGQEEEYAQAFETRADRRDQAGQQFHDGRALELLELRHVLKIDGARPHLHYTAGSFRLELGRGIASEYDDRHTTLARLGEHVGRERVGDAVDKFRDRIGRGRRHDQRVIDAFVEEPYRRRRRSGVAEDTEIRRQARLVHPDDFARRPAHEEVDV